MATRVVRDAVHGLINLDRFPWLVNLVNAREFQRLRRISQLGTSSATYPGATHSRFSHSLGVMCVFLQVVDHFQRIGQALGDEEVIVGTCASLLHDIGHAPFSHALEQALGGGGHEEWTRKIILSSESDVHGVLCGIDGALPQKVEEVIAGTSPLRKVVGLISSQLDADRMDYLLRDSLHAGVGYGHYDLARMIFSLEGFDRDGAIFLSRKAIPLAEQYVVARYHMYWQVYFHKTTRCVERMLVKCLQLARRQEVLPESLSALASPDPNGSCAAFLGVDESDVMQALKTWAGPSSCPTLRRLAAGVLCRKLFKAVCITEPEGTMDPRTFDRLIRQGTIAQAVRHHGFDPEFCLLVDRASDLPYGRYYLTNDEAEADKPPILVDAGQGRQMPLEKASALVREMAQPVARGVVYVPPECAQSVREVVASG